MVVTMRNFGKREFVPEGRLNLGRQFIAGIVQQQNTIRPVGTEAVGVVVVQAINGLAKFICRDAADATCIGV